MTKKKTVEGEEARKVAKEVYFEKAEEAEETEEVEEALGDEETEVEELEEANWNRNGRVRRSGYGR